VTIYEPGKVGDGLASCIAARSPRRRRECQVSPPRSPVKYGFSGACCWPEGRTGRVTLPPQRVRHRRKREKVVTDKVKVTSTSHRETHRLLLVRTTITVNYCPRASSPPSSGSTCSTGHSRRRVGEPRRWRAKPSALPLEDRAQQSRLEVCEPIARAHARRPPLAFVMCGRVQYPCSPASSCRRPPAVLRTQIARTAAEGVGTRPSHPSPEPPAVRSSS